MMSYIPLVFNENSKTGNVRNFRTIILKTMLIPIHTPLQSSRIDKCKTVCINKNPAT